MHAGLTTAFATLFIAAGIALADAPRQTDNFDKDWKFQIGDKDDFSKADFDDSAWRKLNVPHDYSIEGPQGSDPDDMDGPFDRKSARRARRRRISGCAHGMVSQNVHRAGLGKGEARVGVVRRRVHEFRCVLERQETGQSSVRLHAVPIRFDRRLEIRRPQHAGGPLQVRATLLALVFGAGIFRHVHLITTDPVHIAPWGTYITTEKTGDNEFTVTVHTTVKNDSDKEVKCKTYDRRLTAWA